MKSMHAIFAHFLVLAISSAIVCRRCTFFTLFETMASNKLLHLLHSALAGSIILSLGSFFTNKTMGGLTDSETTAYREKVYDVMGDFVMLVGMFSHELGIRNITTLSLLYAIKSFGWVFGIKSQKTSGRAMLLGSVLAAALALLLVTHNYLSSKFLGLLLCLEYSLVLLSIVKNQLIMVLDMNGVESDRSLFVFIITIVYLALKSGTFLLFIAKLASRHRFPYNTLKSLITTTVKLLKKLVLFKKYINLVRALNTIRETAVEGSCAICTDDIAVGKKLRCTHVFHSHCLKMWCEREMSCPICRADLVFDNEETHETDNEILSGVPIELENE